VGGVGVAGDERGEGPARANGTELAVIAHHHQLCPGRPYMREEAGQIEVVGHPRLIEDDHGPFPQPEFAAVELYGEAGQGRERRRPGTLSESAGGLTGRSCSDHLAP